MCAETVARGRALLEGDGRIEAVFAVRHPKPDEADREMAVVPPRGACQEVAKLPVRGLLPAPYRR